MKFLLAFLCLTSLTSLTSLTFAAGKPNVVIILCRSRVQCIAGTIDDRLLRCPDLRARRIPAG